MDATGVVAVVVVAIVLAAASCGPPPDDHGPGRRAHGPLLEPRDGLEAAGGCRGGHRRPRRRCGRAPGADAASSPTAIEADPTLRARYPYRILDPRPGPDGLGILSRLPLIERVGRPDGRMLQAGLLLPDGRTAELLDVHPRRPLYRTVGPLPVALNTRARDEDVAAIREAVDRSTTRPRRSSSATSTGRARSPGWPASTTARRRPRGRRRRPGFTWRPDAVEPLGIGVLRIDHVLSRGVAPPAGHRRRLLGASATTAGWWSGSRSAPAD